MVPSGTYFVEQRHLGIPFHIERMPAGHHLVEQDADCIDIRTVVHVFRSSLFGRHVQQFTLECTAEGGMHFDRRFGDTEIGEFHISAITDQDVLRGDVPMYHVEGSTVIVFRMVRIIQCRTQLDADDGSDF